MSAPQESEPRKAGEPRGVIPEVSGKRLQKELK